jgi:hypothetical protein
MEIFSGYRLSPWEEAIGIFHKLYHYDGVLIARIGPVAVHLPFEFEETLRPFVGKKIGILRTDDPARPYRFRHVSG